MNISLVIVFARLLAFTFAVSEIGKSCTTPEGKLAKCVPLDTCRVVLNELSLKRNSSKDFLKKSYCGYEDDVLVCCESPGPAVTVSESELQQVLPDKDDCGLVREGIRILGGSFAELDEFPWTAAFEYRSKVTGENAGIKCGGSLINHRYILTAASCLIDREFELISVRLGEWSISTDPDCTSLIANKECADPVQKFSIKEFKPHPYYSRRNLTYDIGLIKLESDVQYTDFIRPICLPFTNFPSAEPGTLMTVAGWGATEIGTSSDVKLKVQVPIVPLKICKEKLSGSNIGKHELCAGGEKGKDSCQGDTGQGLMSIREDKSINLSQWYQEGIVSSGIGCGRLGYPGIYTKVSSHLYWILQVLSEE